MPKGIVDYANEAPGTRYGEWEVIRYVGSWKRRRYLLVRCSCGAEHERRKDQLTNGESTKCNPCAGREHADRCRKKSGANHPSYTGTKDIPGVILSSLRGNARARRLEVSVSKEYLQRLWDEQGARCVYTGRHLDFLVGANRASLDRIDSSKGYIEGNVQWVHKDVNYAKSDLSHAEFLSLCLDVAVKSANYR